MRGPLPGAGVKAFACTDPDSRCQCCDAREAHSSNRTVAPREEQLNLATRSAGAALRQARQRVASTRDGAYRDRGLLLSH